MKSQELIQRVQSLYSKGVQSDDTRLSSRHIFNKLTTVNNSLIFKKLARGESLSNNFYLTLNLNVIPSEIFEDLCLDPVTCNIYRTECEIPKIQFFKNKPLVKSLVSLDGFVKFNYTTFENAKYLKGNKFTHNKQWYFFKDGYIYFIHSMKMKKIRLTAIFENVEKVFTYTCNSNYNNCVDMTDIDFPTDDDLVDVIIQASIQELIGMFMQSREDLTNDNKDSLIQNSK